jgi:hypothetical protein
MKNVGKVILAAPFLHNGSCCQNGNEKLLKSRLFAVKMLKVSPFWGLVINLMD